MERWIRSLSFCRMGSAEMHRRRAAETRGCSVRISTVHAPRHILVILFGDFSIQSSACQPSHHLRTRSALNVIHGEGLPGPSSM